MVDVLGSPGGLRPQRPLLLIALPFGLCIGIRLVLALLVVVVMVVVVLVILSGALSLHQCFVSSLLCTAALRSRTRVSQ